MPEAVIVGYSVGLGILALMVGGLWWRYRRLAADEAAVARLEAEDKSDEVTLV